EPPLPERKLGALQDGPDSDAELVAAGVAIELPPPFEAGDTLGCIAARAAYAARPPELFEVSAAPLLRAEGSQGVLVGTSFGRLGSPEPVENGCREQLGGDFIGAHRFRGG